MKVKKIELHNFRSYEKLEMVFNSGCSIIVGPNATGKSSILEALSVLGTTKSFRKAKDSDLVRFGEKSFYIQGIVENDDETSNYKVSVSFFEGFKKTTKNENTFKKISDYLNCLYVVSFSTFDFLLINGSPLDRRKFLNLLNVQIENKNSSFLNEYEKILKEKNFLLKKYKMTNRQNDLELLKILSFQLIEKGKKIITMREEIIKKINTYFDEEYKKLSGSVHDLVEIKYSCNVFADQFEVELEENLNEEIEKGVTLKGPHRDDFLIMFNGKNIAISGSQGQQRDALLALKISVAKIIFDEKKENPVLLLDDVFSELDSERQNRIIKSLDKKMQTIITTTTLSDIKKEILSTATVIELRR